MTGKLERCDKCLSEAGDAPTALGGESRNGVRSQSPRLRTGLTCCAPLTLEEARMSFADLPFRFLKHRRCVIG